MRSPVAFLLSLFAFASVAKAGPLCDLVAELNRTVGVETPYATPPCPVIGFAQLPRDGGVRSQAGAYFPDTGRIELAADLDLASIFAQSYLLHELVHAAQYADDADRTAACPAALEAEAYGVQAAFLRQHGLAAEAMTVSILAMQLGACGQADY